MGTDPVTPPTVPNVDRLRRVGLEAGLAAVGFTGAEVLEPARSLLALRKNAGLAATMQFTYRNPERSTDPTRILDGARSMVVGLLDYRRDDPQPNAQLVGRVARYSRRDYYAELRSALSVIADELIHAGFEARVVADSNALVDRNAAWRAGLGWYGKNTNLLVEGSGSWHVLGAVVTDAQLTPLDVPINDGCGSCTACIDQCPTNALVAPGVLDARRCIAWLVQAGEPIPIEFRSSIGDWLYGCDICQEVCPPNRVSSRRTPLPAAEPDAQAFVDLVWLLEASDFELLDEVGRWYLAKRDPDVVRRTALVVLGNIAPPADPQAGRLLQRYVRHDRPFVRAHAVWAARRLGFDDLALPSRNDPDPLVRAEWDHAVELRSVEIAGIAE